jgi:anaerobic ribonucleoside-triphosphate reductase activating protein
VPRPDPVFDPAATPLRLHALLPRSRANGPGERACVWFQGCALACPGCFNPDTHAFVAGKATTVGAVLERLQLAQPLAGLTISGGEPFAQPASLHALLALFRARTGLTTLVFSGYALREIERMVMGPAILGEIDLLVAGRFAIKQRVQGRPLLGSANQRLHYLSGRIHPEELGDVADAELVIDAGGRVAVTGLQPPGIVDQAST